MVVSFARKAAHRRLLNEYTKILRGKNRCDREVRYQTKSTGIGGDILYYIPRGDNKIKSTPNGV